MRKHKIPNLRWRGRLEVNNWSQRVCRACDNVTTHYQVNGYGKQWLCWRIWAELRRQMLREGHWL